MHHPFTDTLKALIEDLSDPEGGTGASISIANNRIEIIKSEAMCNRWEESKNTYATHDELPDVAGKIDDALISIFTVFGH